ncbi:MAG: peptidase Ste24p, partial [Solirubrobacterales bacterium]|nr:peptidase Ste24p [Solirubrobacterales bacterium]
MSTTKRSNFAAGLRTTILLATLTGLFVVIGFALGGPETALLFLFFGAAFNLGAWWFSDKIALKMSGAKPLSEQEAPRLYQMVRELTTRAGLPMPSLHLIPQAQPNAFATGRSHDKSAVAVTQGILQVLSEDELRGVIAHELAHIRNRDVLIQSVAATIGGAITYLAYTLMWFGGDDESPLGLVGSLAMVILAPLAATIVQ